ncbi:MAG: AarF/UbiB family protein, partial [Candidatus Caenarcaniphilales bacterium]|nr:AarF/UbiB family protein [Candidatus Caenarcaniphilales bacterium]
MQYHSSLAKKIFPIPEPAVFPQWLGFLNFILDSFIILFHSLRNRRFLRGAKLAVILWLSVKQEVDYETGKNSLQSQKKFTESRKKHAKWLYQSLTQLGAAFIKVGQFISTREDLMPKEYVDELSALQDFANPLPVEIIEQTIQQSLGKPINQLFASFDPLPLASASIGQVHRATTLDGEEIVIKIQRPNLDKIFLQDLAIARAFSVFFERYSSWGRHRYWPEICDEFGKVLFEEIDFVQEALNAERMKFNLEKDHPELLIPQVYEEYTTKSTLALKYIPGFKITDTEALKTLGRSNEWLSEKLLEVFLGQFFKHSFFHADPHPGNLAVTKEGKIVLYDFGMTYRIDSKVKENFKNAIVALVAQNSDELIHCLARMDLLRPGADIELLRSLINKTTYKYYGGTSFRELNLENIKDDINKVIANSPIRMPPSLAYVFRTLGILEGLCRSFDPNFNFIGALKPYTREWLMESKQIGVFEKLLAKLTDKLTEKFEIVDFSDLIELAKIPSQANKLFQKINNNEFEIPIDLA